MDAPRPPQGLPAEWYFTPGPTQMHPCVPGELARAVGEGLASESHRSEPFRREMARTNEALRALLGVPDSHRLLYLGSATEAMERILEGGVEFRSHHLVNGAFAKRFHGVARALGRDASSVVVPDGEGFDLDDLQVPEGTELVALTQNETSTGVALDPAGISRLRGRLDPRSLLAVDGVTATPTAPLSLEAVDAFFFSVQKLFGLPAGLGVLVASPALVERAREFRGRGVSIGGFLHLPALADTADRNETPATPNALALRLLGTVALDYLERGLDRIRSEAEWGAERLGRAAEAAGWTPFVSSPEDRSRTILIYRTEDGGNSELRSALRARGYRVGDGYGPHKGAQLRVANFPVHPPEAIDGLARAIESL